MPRRLLGIDAIDTETHASWRAFLLALRERGVHVTISDTAATTARSTREQRSTRSSGK